MILAIEVQAKLWYAAYRSAIAVNVTLRAAKGATKIERIEKRERRDAAALGEEYEPSEEVVALKAANHPMEQEDSVIWTCCLNAISTTRSRIALVDLRPVEAHELTMPIYEKLRSKDRKILAAHEEARLK